MHVCVVLEAVYWDLGRLRETRADQQTLPHFTSSYQCSWEGRRGGRKLLHQLHSLLPSSTGTDPHVSVSLVNKLAPAQLSPPPPARPPPLPFLPLLRNIKHLSPDPCYKDGKIRRPELRARTLVSEKTRFSAVRLLVNVQLTPAPDLHASETRHERKERLFASSPSPLND